MLINNLASKFQSDYAGKTVLVTGHTGFKGSWIVAWLVKLGANVVGVALDPPTEPSHFKVSEISKRIKDLRIDIRDGNSIQETIVTTKPNFVFHLAAQSLVKKSYENPIETWQTNVIGTLNILEALRKLNEPCTTVIITSDKCYKNKEQVFGYAETDELGGIDPYSASKAAAEIAIQSHINNFFSSKESLVRIATARAGNVIGGGDWAQDRIIPDCVKKWSQSLSVNLRNPNATRPWQHVLEPLSGYLALALALGKDSKLHGEAFNFGPQPGEDYSVFELVEEMSIHWDKAKWRNATDISDKHYESTLLRLNCNKALSLLDWQGTMNFKETISMTAEWYQSFYLKPEQILDITNNQIDKYISLAKSKGLQWAQ